MATIKEHIAQHTRSEAATQQQPIADDPLAPTPIRFTHRRDANGVIHQRSVNEPTTGWHLEDDAAGEGVEPPPRLRGQAYTPSRQTRDSQQQARVTQAYPGHVVLPVPGADCPADSPAAPAPPASHRACARSTATPSHTTQEALDSVPGDGHSNYDRPGHRLVQPGKLVATRAGRLDLWHASDVPDRCRGGT